MALSYRQFIPVGNAAAKELQLIDGVTTPNAKRQTPNAKRQHRELIAMYQFLVIRTPVSK